MADADHMRLAPWIAGSIAAVVGALWAALRGQSAREVARLEAALTHERAERERERGEARGSLERLGAKLDAERQGRDRDIRRAARALYLAREGRDVGHWEAEAPTGVHDLLALSSPRPPPDPHPELADWDPTQSTPPGQYEPPLPARGRLPSKPR